MAARQKVKTLKIFGEIEDNTFEYVFETFSSKPEDGIPVSKITHLDIFINTGGGSLLTCFALMDYITYMQNIYKFTIRTIGVGVVASAGFFLFLLGSNRITFPRCRFLVHEHLEVVDGVGAIPYDQKMKEIKEDRKMHKIYIDWVAIKLDLPMVEAEKLVKHNGWLDQSTLLKYHVITGQIDAKSGKFTKFV